MNERSIGPAHVRNPFLLIGLHTLGLLLGLSGTALAEGVANPALFARVNGVENGEANRRSLQIASLQIDTWLKGSIAHTTLTARFANPNRENVEGEFALELPAGSAVVGYSLDIDGRMVDGVLVDQPKAREVYEDKVRQGIDPGIATVSRGNVFTTRVFPIRPQSGRTIRLSFIAPVHADKGWAIPLVGDLPVGELSIRVRTDAVQASPRIVLPGKLTAQWETPGGKRLSVESSNVKLSGELRIAPVTPSKALLFSTHTSGQGFFQIADKMEISDTRTLTADRVRVYWDRSRSRLDQLLKEELSLLTAYIAATRPKAIDIVLFNSSGAKFETRTSASEVTRLLNDTVYRGATSFAVLDGLDLPSADACLMFSDGVATIDGRDRFAPNCPMMAITSAAAADRSFLRRVTGKVGGEVLTLRADSHKDTLTRLLRRYPTVVDVRDVDNRRLPYTVVSSTIVGTKAGWIVVGEAPVSRPIVVSIAGLGKGIIERRYEVRGVNGTEFDGEGALWAADRIADLAADDNRLKEVRALSKRYSVANPAVAFLVLETPQDYAAAGIVPPKNYPASQFKEYQAAKAELDEDAAEARAERLDDLVASWEEQKRWWSTKFDPGSYQRSKARIAEARRAAGPPPPAMLEAPAPAAVPLQSQATSELDTVVVTAQSIRHTPEDSALPVEAISHYGPSTRIELEPWNPDRPYLKALGTATDATRNATLLAQEKKHGALPAFYLDTAEWFSRKGRRAEAMELLLSALDLEASNEDTVSIVAERLIRYGEFDRAIWLHEKNLATLDFLPQPRRALALALVKRAQAATAKQPKRDLLRALHLLDEIVMHTWQGDYDGIEMISLMDANAIIPALKKLGVTKTVLDPRLIALLDVDLRVVVDWNTGNTDVDLWIDEPTGERVLYNHPRSASGGRLSNDMTSGYGPEEYLLHHAPPGKYRVRLHVYAPDRINPNGATIVTTRLIRDFGRRTQREEVIDLELKVGDEGEKLVGEFEVAR